MDNKIDNNTCASASLRNNSFGDRGKKKTLTATIITSQVDWYARQPLPRRKESIAKAPLKCKNAAAWRDVTSKKFVCWEITCLLSRILCLASIRKCAFGSGGKVFRNATVLLRVRVNSSQIMLFYFSLTLARFSTI